jgi:hypothetical protein
MFNVSSIPGICSNVGTSAGQGRPGPGRHLVVQELSHGGQSQPFRMGRPSQDMAGDDSRQQRRLPTSGGGFLTPGSKDQADHGWSRFRSTGHEVPAPDPCPYTVTGGFKHQATEGKVREAHPHNQDLAPARKFYKTKSPAPVTFKVKSPHEVKANEEGPTCQRQRGSKKGSSPGRNCSCSPNPIEVGNKEVIPDPRDSKHIRSDKRGQGTRLRMNVVRVGGDARGTPGVRKGPARGGLLLTRPTLGTITQSPGERREFTGTPEQIRGDSGFLGPTRSF